MGDEIRSPEDAGLAAAGGYPTIPLKNPCRVISATFQGGSAYLLDAFAFARLPDLEL